MQGRPPGAPLPRVSGQLSDRTVSGGRVANISSQNRSVWKNSPRVAVTCRIILLKGFLGGVGCGASGLRL